MGFITEVRTSKYFVKKVEKMSDEGDFFEAEGLSSSKVISKGEHEASLACFLDDSDTVTRMFFNLYMSIVK